MPTVSLQLQMKFLNDLDAALDEAMAKHRFDQEKVSELRYMHAEVLRAREVVLKRIRSEIRADQKKHPPKTTKKITQKVVQDVEKTPLQGVAV